jgi:NAD(P)-dependent dehydrogenase (short-subunit alcohol dehydrogenase family)
MGAFTGKTVLITGASEGIGRALALALAGHAAQLVLAARSAPRLEELAAECSALGAQVEAVPTDVAQPAACVRCVERAVARFGGLDVLVNNAGITMWSRFEAITDLSVFEQLLAVNVMGSVRLTAAALPHLKASRGLIVAVASIAGLTGVPERTGYAASKHAMVGFFESLRIELRDSGVDVTIIAPDFVISQIHRRAWAPMAAAGNPDGRVKDHDRRTLRGADRGRDAAPPAAAHHLPARSPGALGAPHRAGSG